MLTLSAGADRGIRRHGREAYPYECCGALIGSAQRVVEALALPNAAEANARRRFRIRPADYLAAERRANELGAGLLGFYHSHPDHPARPSRYDLEHAWPGFAYIIVGVDQGEPAALTAWRLQEDRSAFEEETVAVAPDGGGPEHHTDEASCQSGF